MRQFGLTINGQSKTVTASGAERLSNILRNQIGLQGTKSGCDAGDCGACTVLIDGETACSCLVPIAQIENCHISTIEGLGKDNKLSDLQESFLQFGAAQCGICTPGMLVSAHALLNENPTPTRQQVQDALGGVLCRCTGYQKIIDAVMHATSLKQTELKPGAGQSVGSAIRHLDGQKKVTGQLAFGADQLPEDALFVKLISSPYHHAQFSIGDHSQLVEQEGIDAVLTAADVPGKNSFGVIPQFADQPVFAENFVRFRGEVIAAIVGEKTAIENFNEQDFPVSWQKKDPVLTSDAARLSNAKLVHEKCPGNILVKGLVKRGNAEKAFSNAHHQTTINTSTPFIEHAYIEPEAGYAYREQDRIIINGCTQSPQMDREAIAEILGLDIDQVRVKPSACGGGFGSKIDISFQPFVALAAWKLNRPVAICYSRTHSIASTTKRHPSQIELKVGCDNDGKITGFLFDGVFNTGAYASWGPTVANRVPVHASGPYFIADYDARSTAVYTHCAPAGAFRGFGVPQAAIAQEAAFDDLANKTGIDRLEFRLNNCIENGMATVTGQVFKQGVGIKKCLESLKPAWQSAVKNALDFNQQGSSNIYRKGVGIASCWYGCGNTSLPNPSTIRMGITAQGKIVLHQGAMDIGQGSNTVITQIAADALGVRVHMIDLLDGDTDITPDCGKTSASRQTFITGCAAKLAGEALRKKILRQGNCSEQAKLEFNGSTISLGDDQQTSSIDLAAIKPNQLGYVFMAEETYDPPTSPLDENGQGEPYAIFGYGAQIVELTIDTKLGTVKLDKITAAHDVGKAINPMLVEGQIEGGIAQGIGLALMEEFQPGVTENLHDYLIPTIGDLPEIENIIIEDIDVHGPYGAKGLGEHVLIPTAPATLNAICHATGAKVHHTPATPDKVLAAINKLNTQNANAQ